MSKKEEHLPLMGVGPIYVIVIVLITVLLLFLSFIKKAYSVNIGTLKIPMMIIGMLFIVFGVFIWTRAVIKTNIDDHIKKNQLVTTGIYAWVRNPIYSAFLFLCTGVLLFCNNLLFLTVPVFYWTFLTILMIHTEERWLEKEFGDEYLAYKAKVNRCIPFPPRNQ